MLKRITALLLAVLLMCLCVGCGNKTEKPTDTTAAETTDTASDPAGAEGRIAILVGDSTQEPELYAAVKALADAYGDTIMLLRYSSTYQTSSNGLTDSALAAARDDSVKALIFAGGVNGTANAAQFARKERSDLCIIACNPLEGTDALASSADLVLSVDFTALAKDLVARAKTMGAENFVFYTTDRELKLPMISAMRKTVEQSCEAEAMTCKAAGSINLLENGNTLDLAKQYLAEDAQRRLETFGEKTALFSTEPQVQGALAKATAERGLVMPGTFLPSPLLLAADLGVDLAGHETDSAYAFEQLQAAAKKNGTAGHVATWRFSASVGLLQAAFDYALDVLSGDAGQTPDSAVVEQYVKAHTDDGVKLTAKNGVFLLTAESVVL